MSDLGELVKEKIEFAKKIGSIKCPVCNPKVFENMKDGDIIPFEICDEHIDKEALKELLK